MFLMSAKCWCLRATWTGVQLSKIVRDHTPCCSDPPCLLLQLEKVDVLLSQWRGRVAILLNAEWTPDTVPSGFKAFDRGFDVIYCFFPLSFQVSHWCTASSPG